MDEDINVNYNVKNLSMIDKIKNFLSNYKIISALIIYAFICLSLYNDIGKVSSGSNPDGLIMTLYWIIYLLIAAIGGVVLSARKTDISKNRFKIYLIIIFIVLFLMYPIFIKACQTPACLINPQSFIPLFIYFAVIVKNTKYFYIYMFLFMTIPLSLVLVDKIEIYKFLSTCDEITPKAEYNPIYLPKEYFHEETVDGEIRLVPNIEYKDSLNYENAAKPYIYIECVISLIRIILMDSL